MERHLTEFKSRQYDNRYFNNSHVDTQHSNFKEKMFLHKISIRCYSSKWNPTAITNLSISPYLHRTDKSCPQRNCILGLHFFKFAVSVSAYTDPMMTHSNRSDHKLLNDIREKNFQKLALVHHHQSIGDDRIKLPSTGKYLDQDITKALNRWKFNAHHEIQCDSDAKKIHQIFNYNCALIGWYLQTYGMVNTIEFIEWLGVPIRINKNIENVMDDIDSDQQKKIDSYLDGYDAVEKILRYTFQNKRNMLHAFCHESFNAVNSIGLNYGSLDFVGDSILNYIIVRHLFRDSRQFSAEDLSNLLQLLISNSNYATVSVRHGIYKFIRHTDPMLRDCINSFVAAVQRNKCKPIDDSYILDKNGFIFEVPSMIPDNFEALVAAIYFDSNMNLNTVANVILNLMQKDIEVISETKPKSALNQLFELDPNAKFSEPQTMASGQILVTVTLPRFGNETFSARSRSKKLAKWGAAKEALIQLNKQSNPFIPIKSKDVSKQFGNI